MENRVLDKVSSLEVFKYFEDISRIPRGSGNEKEISDYMVNFAKELGLFVIQDEALNVIIRKDGTKGYENSPRVIIQGHVDMVCEKNIGTDHDFLKDPLKLRVDGDYIYATDTTLGGDNGIAVAYAMAILASNVIEHPPLEVLLTTEEETGMGGAIGLKSEDIEGKILINIDSEEEGKLLVSCAGGLRTHVKLPIEHIDSPLSEGLDCVVKVRGLKGGHSGMDINKERGNANKIMGRFLNKLNRRMDLYLLALNGGAKDNAIPRECDATIKIYKSSLELLKERIRMFNEIIKNELRTSDSGVHLEVEVLDKLSGKCLSKASTEKVIKLLYLMPNGIETMSMDIEGLVQSSTNVGVVRTFEDYIEISSAVRSSVESLKRDIVDKTKALVSLVGATVEEVSDYPEWQYDKDSKIREVFVKVYEDVHGKKPEIAALHAGLECGLFKKKLKDVDMISFGPNLYDVHTPNEHMSIGSVERCFEYLVKVLKEIK